MGYTMVTMIDGKEYRYTEWVSTQATCRCLQSFERSDLTDRLCFQVDYGTKAKYTPDWERNVVSAATIQNRIPPAKNAGA